MAKNENALTVEELLKENEELKKFASSLQRQLEFYDQGINVIIEMAQDLDVPEIMEGATKLGIEVQKLQDPDCKGFPRPLNGKTLKPSIKE